MFGRLFKIKKNVMKNRITILIFLFSVVQIFSQEVCIIEDKALLDVNTLNKCEVEKGDRPKDITKDLIVSGKRYLKKRAYFNEVSHSPSHLKPNTLLKIKLNNKLDTRLLLMLRKQPIVEEVPFDSVEEIPLFVSCSESFLGKTECFNYEMEKHISKHFSYPEKALQKGIEGDLLVSFIIDVNGNIKDIKVSGTNDSKILINEVKRIVLLLPKFTPGKQNGVETNVLYSFPMSFTLD
jgi:TonB family protein